MLELIFVNKYFLNVLDLEEMEKEHLVNDLLDLAPQSRLNFLIVKPKILHGLSAQFHLSVKPTLINNNRRIIKREIYYSYETICIWYNKKGIYKN